MRRQSGITGRGAGRDAARAIQAQIRETAVQQTTQATVGTRGQLTTATDMLTFALAGCATLTLVSEKTGVRYTFKISQPKGARPNCPYFVSVMYGSDNETEFAYLGCIYPDRAYRHGKKSALPVDDIREKAFVFFWNNVTNGRCPPQLAVWHEGKCCRCGRKLTVPESIANGIGPECIKLIRPINQPSFLCEAA